MATAKIRMRAALWSQLHMALHHTAVAYNVFLASLLGFLVQLEPLPPYWKTTEAAIMRKLIPGPGSWMLPRDMHDLAEMYGMP